MSRETSPAGPARTPPASGQIKVTIADPGETVEGVADLSAELRDRLRWLHVDRVTRSPGVPAPAGTFAVDLGDVHSFLVELTASASLIRQVMGVLLDWQRLKPGRSVQVEIPGHHFTLDSAAPRKTAEQVEAVLASLEPGERPRAGRRLALLVANSRYEDARLRPLNSPVTDAEHLAEILAGLGDFEVEVVANQQSGEIMRRIADTLKQRSREDLVVLYYSGHGLLDTDVLYLAAPDTRSDQPFNAAVPASFLRQQLGNSDAGSVLVILDCCYSGAFPAFLARSEAQLADTHRGGRAHTVITSTTAVQLAHERPDVSVGGEQQGGYRSCFAEALVHSLLTGPPDQEGGWISHLALFGLVQQRLSREGAAGVQSTTMSGVAQQPIRVSRVPSRLFPAVDARLAVDDPDQHRLAVLDLKWTARAEPSPPVWAARAVLRHVAGKNPHATVRREARDALGDAAEVPRPGPPPPAPVPSPGGDVDAPLGRRVLAGAGALVCALQWLHLTLTSGWGLTWTWPFLGMAVLLVAGTAALVADRFAGAAAAVVCAVLAVQLGAQLTAAEYALATGGRDWLAPWYRGGVTDVVTGLGWTTMPLLVLLPGWLVRGTRWRVDRRRALAVLGTVVAAGLSGVAAVEVTGGGITFGAALRVALVLAVGLLALRHGPAGGLDRVLAGALVLGCLAVLPGFPVDPWSLAHATAGRAATAVAASLIGSVALVHGGGPFRRRAPGTGRAAGR